MVGDGSFRHRILQNAAVYHIIGPLKGLLTGLEHELDGALQLPFPLLQQLGGGEQHGSMEIMTAGVGLGARGTGEGFSAVLRHGQRIHICPQQDAFAAASQGGCDTMAAGPGLQPHFPQLLRHIGAGIGQIQAHLRIAVKPAPMGGGFMCQLQRSFVKIHKQPSLIQIVSA